MGGGGGGTSYNVPYEEAPPERGTLLRMDVHKRVYRDFTSWKRAGKTVI